ncbi:cupin-like domain-containing protein [Parvicella tangerina]|uniref:JmjC domain-containing protein n=1 Tax=Parvicella tangerina TaxID=2829795 RepID=A0A916NB18_9FLAO|nr:cupin-like domain-containing protein [Parvicella tangerina]CAG5080198.1 hypothetical protein CRYO30217_01216 [Parvicella tangerina]
MKKIATLDEITIDESNIDSFFRDYFDVRKPVIIKNGAEKWPLMWRWNKEYIVKKAGKYPCIIVNDSRPAASRKTDTIKNYFAIHKGKSTLTLQRYNKQMLLPILKDVPIPSLFFSDENIKRYFFYHAPVEAGTLPHTHRDAFNILRSGTKKWIFHDALEATSPEGKKMVDKYYQTYPKGTTAKNWFEEELPQLQDHLEETQVYQCIQEAGDIVYIPYEYMHTVLNLSEVMGVVFERAR